MINFIIIIIIFLFFFFIGISIFCSFILFSIIITVTMPRLRIPIRIATFLLVVCNKNDISLKEKLLHHIATIHYNIFFKIFLIVIKFKFHFFTLNISNNTIPQNIQRNIILISMSDQHLQF